MNTSGFIYGLIAAVAAALLGSCSSGNQTSAIMPQAHGAPPHHGKPNAGCTSIQDSTGATYTAARTGGGANIDVEYSTTPCQIGIYINGSNGQNTLDHTMVNGGFLIGIYFDTAGGAHEDHTQICVNGSNTTGGCVSGTNASPGTGLDIRNTPRFSADHTSIDSYKAGFATNPCPNNNNNMTVDHTVITNATYAWSYEGGNNNFNFQPGHDSPPFNGDSCAGSGVGVGNAPPGQITEYSVSCGGAGITTGPDGALWATGSGCSSIAQITTSGAVNEYPIFNGAGGVTTGSDGALWIGGAAGACEGLGRITTSGSFTDYPTTPCNLGLYGITSGPDGALWAAAASEIVRATTAGTVTNYYTITAPDDPATYQIAVGPDGALWFTESRGDVNRIGRITTGGAITDYQIPRYNCGNYQVAPLCAYGITAGPDGAMWFAGWNSDYIGRITMGGVISQYPITSGAQPIGIAAGPDGNLWFTENGANKIGRMTTSGIVTGEWTIPTANSGPFAITAGPDNAMWFSEDNGSKVARITTGLSPNAHRTHRLRKEALRGPSGR